MKIDEYIRNTLAQNRLIETADWLIDSSEEVYYADRHVARPPEGMTPLAAIQAGWALLLQWDRELSEVRGKGLSVSKPMLVVDADWFEGRVDAPPPHVFVSLAKRPDLIILPEVDGKRVEASSVPFSDLLSESLQSVCAIRIGPCEDRESRGGWVIYLPAS